MRYKLIKARSPVSVIFELFSLLVLVILLIIPVVIENIIARKLNDSEVTSVRKVAISVLSRGITLIDFKATDLLINEEMLVNGSISKLQVTGIPFHAILLKDDVILNEVALWNSNIVLAGKKKVGHTTSAKSNPEIKLKGIKTLIIYEGNFQYTDVEGGNYLINQLTAEISPVMMDSATTFHPLPQFSFLSGPVNYLTPDSLYRFSVNEIHGGSRNRLMVFDSVKISPAYSENEFTKHLKFQSDRIEFDASQITVSMHETNEEEIYHFEMIHIAQPRLLVFRDKRIARDPDMKYKSLQYYLREIKLNFLVDSFKMDQADIRYRERMEGSDETGEIAFTKADINGFRLQSGSEADSSLTLYMNSGFMSSGTIAAKLEFPYTKDFFTCKGELKDMPMKELNRITVPNAGVVFNSGAIRSMQFEFTANTSHSQGNLNLQYRDMNFTALNKPSGETGNLLSRIETFVAGIFLRKETTQPNTEISLKGKICAERKTDRFIFNYIWKSILSGIKSAMTETFTPDDMEASSKTPC